MDDMGGWSLTEAYAKPGTLCLQAEETRDLDIVYNEKPLTASQMHALGEHLIRAANEMEAKA
jgi:hypothetical protein